MARTKNRRSGLPKHAVDERVMSTKSTGEKRNSRMQARRTTHHPNRRSSQAWFGLTTAPNPHTPRSGRFRNPSSTGSPQHAVSTRRWSERARTARSRGSSAPPRGTSRPATMLLPFGLPSDPTLDVLPRVVPVRQCSRTPRCAYEAFFDDADRTGLPQGTWIGGKSRRACRDLGRIGGGPRPDRRKPAVVPRRATGAEEPLG